VLNGLEDTDSSNIVSSGKHNGGSVGELDNSRNFTSGEVNLYFKNRV